MRRFNSGLGLNFTWICFIVLLLPLIVFVEPSQALTASSGQPYHGRLINGIPFPSQLPGYKLREQERTYTTPEVVGAVLDAVDAVRNRFPDTCDLYIGDFSAEGGGSVNHHRSHQNGRDVDLGMYAKDNRPLDSFKLMDEDNLDVAKTWCLIETIIRSQRVQYIFLDRRIQRLLYDHAAAEGTDTAYLDRIFGDERSSLIRHVRNHADHIHVRFFTPWSTLAAHIDESEDQKRMVIEMAQQAYLPKRVNYYVKGNERSLDALAKSFGVTRRDLCRWNQINGGSALTPGSCLVFYKRGFEMEPVRLAQSLQPSFIAEAPPIKYASLRATESSRNVVSDVETSPPEPASRERARRAYPQPSAPTVTAYKVKSGDTLDKIAKRNNVDISTLCRINGWKRAAAVKPGQTIKLASVNSTPTQVSYSGSTIDSVKTRRGKSSIDISLSADPRKSSSSTAAFHTAQKGETLQRISRRTGIGIDALCRMNCMKKDTELKPGQKIKLAPVEMSVCAVPALPEKGKKSGDVQASRSMKISMNSKSSRSARKDPASSKVSSGKSSRETVKSAAEPKSAPKSKSGKLDAASQQKKELTRVKAPEKPSAATKAGAASAKISKTSVKRGR